MMAMIFQKALVLLLLVKNGLSTPVMEFDKASKYEEYVIEHEISTLMARNSVMSMDVGSIFTPPGCHVCTDEEKHYCLGRDLINDHCCCDKRYHDNELHLTDTCSSSSKTRLQVLPVIEQLTSARINMTTLKTSVFCPDLKTPLLSICVKYLLIITVAIEMFPFIPHTCYLGKQLCTTVLSNCEEYYRLRTCCCQKLALIKWKSKSSSTSVMKNGTIIASLILLNYFLYIYFT